MTAAARDAPATRGRAGAANASHRYERRSGTDTGLKPAVDRRSAVQAIFLAAFVLLITLPAIENGFVSLDDSLYLSSPAVQDGLTLQGVAFAFASVTDLYWHPLAWLSHELDVELFGTNPAGHHFVSVLLHAVSAALLFLVLRRLGAGAGFAAGGALIWALHPLRVESFAWVAERKDVLCALFFSATILAYLRHAEAPSRWRYLAWIGLGTLALMSKPSAVSLPLVLLLLDVWPLHRTAVTPNILRAKLPLFAFAAAVMFLTVYGQQQSGSMSHLADVPSWVRLQNAPIFCIRYIGNALWPLNLACFYPYSQSPAPVAVVGSFLLVCSITIIAIRQRRRRPWLLVGCLWSLVALLPNLGLLQAGRQSIADRFTHIAMIGAVVALVFTISEWAGESAFRRRLAGASICGTLAFLTAVTWRQISFWHDSERLFEHALSVQESDYMRGALAAGLLREHRYAEAEPHLRVALRLAPGRFEHHNNLANVLLRTGRFKQAEDEAAEAQRLAPDDISVAETMALILFRRGDPQGALNYFDRAVRLGADPVPVATALNDMGASLAFRGQPEEAEPLIRRALRLNPGLVQARRNLAAVLEDLGREDQAGLPR